MWIVSWLKKKFMYCVYMYVFCHFKKINEKKPWENIFFLQMTVLYTKYKAENNALWAIYVKYGLKIYWEVWKVESVKVWNFEIKNV